MFLEILVMLAVSSRPPAPLREPTESGISSGLLGKFVTELNASGSVSGDPCFFSYFRIAVLVTIYVFQGPSLQPLHNPVLFHQ